MSNLLASLGHTGRRIVLGPTLSTLQPQTTKKKSHNVLSKFMVLCWAAFTAILGCVRPAGGRLDTPGRACSCLPGSRALRVPAPSPGEAAESTIQKNTGFSVRHIRAQVPTACFQLPDHKQATLPPWCLSFPIWEVGIILVCH